MLAHRAFPLLCLVLSPACLSGSETADLATIYNRSAMAHTADRNPVVLIPGLLGSRLEEPDGTVVWGAFRGDYADPRTRRGAQAMALPMAIGEPLAALKDDVHEAGALEDLEISLFGLDVDIGAYLDILNALGIGGYRDQDLADVIDYGEDHFTCFQFAYDWRRDISEAAAQLDRFLEEREAYVREQYERLGIEQEEIRFDVVAHSMGGLVLRYYLRYGPTPLPEDGSLPELDWEGARRIDRAILVATPNGGSLDAFRDILGGRRIGPLLPSYSSAITGTFVSGYQLLPRPRHGAWGDLEDPLDPDTWERLGWGLANPDAADDLFDLMPDVPDAERRAIAIDHQRKCLERAQQFFRAMDRPASPPPGTDLVLVAGDATPTPVRVEVDPTTGARGAVERAAGDGVVLRSSALLDERLGAEWQPRLISPIAWGRVLFFFEGHLEITKSETFLDNLLYLLLEEPRMAYVPR